MNKLKRRILELCEVEAGAVKRQREAAREVRAARAERYALQDALEASERSRNEKAAPRGREGDKVRKGNAHTPKIARERDGGKMIAMGEGALFDEEGEMVGTGRLMVRAKNGKGAK